MRKFILFLVLSAGLVPTLFAGSSAPDGAIFSDDGTHWTKIDYTADKNTLTIDGTVKATYKYLNQIMYVGNTVFVTATDENNMNYLLKDGIVVEKASMISLITSYSPTSYISSLEGWYTYDAGVFRVKNLEGKTLIENLNAGNSSSAYTIAPKVILTTIYNRNNEKPVSYVNDMVIEGNVSSLGNYKNGKRTEIILFSTDTSGMSQISALDTTSGKIRKLPSYDGVTQNAVILDKKGNIKELQYVVMIGDVYAFVDINGRLTSDTRYDEVSALYAYGDKFFKSVVKDGKKYFHFDGKLFGPYDDIDTLNTSYGYGNMMNNITKIVRWSIFIRKNGKDYIIANGKEFPL